MNFSDFKNSGNVLSKEQMSAVKGGGTCGYKITMGEGEFQSTKVECNVSLEDVKIALKLANISRNWCCEHCGTSSYCR